MAIVLPKSYEGTRDYSVSCCAFFSQVQAIRRGARSYHEAQLHLNNKSSCHAALSDMNGHLRPLHSRLMNLPLFWSTNLERAIFAREVARLFGVDEQLSFMGALLADIILPVLTTQRIEHYLHYWSRLASVSELTQFERSRFGWDHAEAGGHIMLAWNFPDDLVCCVAAHHRGREVLLGSDFQQTEIIPCVLAAMLPDPFHQSPQGCQQLATLQASWPDFDLLKLARVVDDELTATSSAATVAQRFPLLGRCQKALRTSGKASS